MIIVRAYTKRRRIRHELRMLRLAIIGPLFLVVSVALGTVIYYGDTLSPGLFLSSCAIGISILLWLIHEAMQP